MVKLIEFCGERAPVPLTLHVHEFNATKIVKYFVFKAEFINLY